MKGYLSLLATLLGLYILSDLFFHFGDFLNHQVPLSIIALYYLFSLPAFFLLVSPYSFLISVIYTFADMNKNNEILGIRALGFNMFRVSLSTLVCALLLSVTALAIQEKLIFPAEKEVNRIKNQYIEQDKPLSSKLINNIAFRSDNMIFFIPSFNPVRKTLQDTIIFKKNAAGDIQEKLFAKEIRYQNGVWVASNLTSYTLDFQGRFSDKPLFWQERIIPLDVTPQNLASRKSVYSGFASLTALKEEIERLKKIKVSHVLPTLTIELHRHIAEPFTHFFLIIGILPFALEIKKRRVGLSALATGFIFGAVYFFIFTTSMALGRAETILPALATWVAPLFFLVVGLSAPLFMR